MIATPTQHVFLCNSAALPKSVPADAHVLTLNYLSSDPNRLVALKLPKFVDQCYHLPDRILDLLELAAYVFAADRATHRGAKDAVEFHAWSRYMLFVIKVRDAEFWNRPGVKERLCAALRFMTGDLEYSFEFVAGHTTPPTSLFDKEDFAIDLQGPASVVLFSGGLDSLGGVLERLETTNENIYLISHRSGQPSTKKTQAGLVRVLSDKYHGRVHHYSFDCGLANVRGAEETQRTRAFLFGSIAFAVAHRIGLDSFFAYENGVTSLNFLRRQDLINAKASRTTHPQTHALMADFLSEVHGKQMKIVNPFWTKTKADVFTVLDSFKGRNLISSAVSCSKTFQRLGNNSTHCGCCFQCIDRRIAAYAAGLQDIDNAGIYSTDIFKNRIEMDETRTTALDYVRQAVQFSKTNDDGFVMDRLAELSDVTPFVGLEEDAAVEAVWTLCHRHGDQVMNALSEVRRQFDDLRFPLADGSLLQLIAARAHLSDGKSAGAVDKENDLKELRADVRHIKQATDPLSGGINRIGKGVEEVRINTEAMAKNEYELRQENAELQRLHAEGYLKFIEKLNAEDFAAFVAIMAKGNRKAAAESLNIPLRSFYDRVAKWPGMGPEYKRIIRMVEWRKNIGRKIIVRLPDSILGTANKNQPENPDIIKDVKQSHKDKAAVSKDHSELLREILVALADQNPQNWHAIRQELVEIIKDEIPQ